MPRKVTANAGRRQRGATWDRQHQQEPPREPDEPRLPTERDAAQAARQARYAGSQGMCRDEVLTAILGDNNMRVAPLVDADFMRLWLFRLAQAMASENWEQLMETARSCYHAAQSERAKAPRRDEILALPLGMTTIPMRTLGWLEREGIRTVHDLLNRSRQQLMAIHQFGPHCLQECLEALAELGLGESTENPIAGT